MKKMRRTLCCLLALLTLAALAPPVLRAQEESAAKLYKTVEDYPRDQFAEMRALGKTAGRETMELFQREQRELAERYAAKLAARAGLAGLDLFYLGALYNVAGRKKESLEAMRRFLADGAAEGAGQQAQAARNLVVVRAAEDKLFDEAEAARAAYLAHEPKTAAPLPQNEHAPEREAEAFRLAKALNARDLPQARREEFIYAAGETLAEAQSALKRKE